MPPGLGGAAEKIGPGHLGTISIFFSFFFFLIFSAKKVFFSFKKGPNANGGSVAFRGPGLNGLRIRALHLYTHIYIFFFLVVSAATRQGRRDKHSKEVECVTDVPIGT
jgi:hypothetical protein